jgi:hypothetical protein
MKRKGLSNIVATVLLVLLALAAITIIWVFLKPLFSKERFEVSSFEVNMEIVPGSVVYSEGGINLDVKRNPGGDVVSGFSVVVYDDEGKTVVKEVNEEIDEFETKSVYVPYYGELGNVMKVSIVPNLLNAEGDIVKGRIASEFALTNESKQSYFLRFVQVADAHILVSPVNPMNPDGRSASSNAILTYVPECEDSDQDGFPDNANACPWINGTSGASLATLIALEKAIPMINNYSPNFTIFAGDNIAENQRHCSENPSANLRALELLNRTISKLDNDYYLIAAGKHDNYNNYFCKTHHEQVFGDKAKDWNFTIEDNLFIGLFEIEDGPINQSVPTVFNITFLDETLNFYKDKNMKVFINFHTPLECYDEWLGGDVRCRPEDAINDTVRAYKGKYKAIIAFSGHDHANVWDKTDAGDGIYHISTTSLMNYPTEFRIVDVTSDTINFFMSGSVDEGVDYASKTIMENYRNSSGDLAGWNPMTSYGEEWERNIFIDLR